MMKPFELISRAKIRTEIKDPELRRKVTPNFRIGCKRMLIANDWYPTLDREHVELVTDGIREIEGRRIITEDGTAREVDAIIVATGFHVTDSPMFDVVAATTGEASAKRSPTRACGLSKARPSRDFRTCSCSSARMSAWATRRWCT